MTHPEVCIGGLLDLFPLDWMDREDLLSTVCLEGAILPDILEELSRVRGLLGLINHDKHFDAFL